MKKIASCIALVLTVVAVIFFSTDVASSQSRESEREGRVVFKYPDNVALPRDTSRRSLNFDSVLEAEAAVDRIVQFMGLTRNFVIEASEADDVTTATSEVDGGTKKRRIYYNADYIRGLVARTGTKWAALFVMAHEVGHHLLGHFHDEQGSTPVEEEKIHHRKEREADYYASFVLRYMGASLPQAEAAVNASDDAGSSTHPPKQERLKAIRNGWNRADEIIRGLAPVAAPAPAAPTAAVPPARREREERVSPPQVPSRPAAGMFRISTYNTSRRVAQDWWTWNVFIDAPPEVLNQIRCVDYQLHPTFNPRVYRVCERGTGAAFALKGQGAGIFRIHITILTKDNRQYQSFHDLRFQ